MDATETMMEMMMKEKKNANEKQSGENSLILGLLFENPPTATFLDLSTMPTSYIIHWGKSIEEKGTPR